MKLIDDLNSVSGRLDKLEVLKSADWLDKRVLYYAYHPYKVFHVRGEVTGALGDPIPEMFELLDKLSSRVITGDEARDAVAAFAKEYGDLIYAICNKDLNCGVAAKTINTAFPDLIPSFCVQLAKEVPLDQLKYPMLAQIKFDGVRAVIIIDGVNKVVQVKSRYGRPATCKGLENFILSKVGGIQVVLDCEITMKDGKSKDRTKVSGLFNSSLKGTSLILEDLDINVFDCIPLKAFQEKQCALSYSTRRDMAEAVVHSVNHLEYWDILKLATNKLVNSAQEASDYFDQLYSLGYEGLILKSRNHCYTFKRSKDWVKVKAVNSTELICIEYIPGKPGTKYQNKLGSLRCAGKVGNELVEVCVGSGFSDADRELREDDYVGKPIEIKYNDIMKAQEGSDTEYTLFLPVFLAVREDLL